MLIPVAVFDDDTMCQPQLLVPSLPDLPATDWTRMVINRSSDGTLESTISSNPLWSVQQVWHPERIDVLSLPNVKEYRSTVHEVTYHGRPAITKIACFDWQISNIDNETWAYSVISQRMKQNPDARVIAPKFLGHLTENGRVMGMLLEKVEGDFATIEDFRSCETAVRKVHALGLTHGDINRYNFVIDRLSLNTYLVDFEHAETFGQEKADLEIQVLPAELTEETGRGKHTVQYLTPGSFGSGLLGNGSAPASIAL